MTLPGGHKVGGNKVGGNKVGGHNIAGHEIGSHIPVMPTEMLAALNPRDGAVYLDGTFGGGGYARAILDHARCHVWAIDRDETAIARGANLAAQYPGRLHLLHGRFGEMLTLLTDAGVHALDGVVLDLGVSSFQIDDPARGFSFMGDGPLDMRMGRHGTAGEKASDLTAATLVNTLPERELADLLFQLGEERASRRVARAIVAARAEAPIVTTGRLASIIRAVLPPDKSGHHPATRSFQALRLSVNDELGEIERGLAHAARLVSPGGRIVVVSFHSLEDRIVKRFMTDVAGRTPAPSRHDPRGLADTGAAPARFRLVTPKALRPGSSEVAANPRARSARLRAIECLADAASSSSGPSPSSSGSTRGSAPVGIVTNFHSSSPRQMLGSSPSMTTVRQLLPRLDLVSMPVRPTPVMAQSLTPNSPSVIS